MKNYIGLALALISLQIYGQPGKDVKLSEKVFYSDFNEEDKSVWPLKNNQYYSFYIQNGKYHLSCLATDKRTYLLPKGATIAEVFRIEATVAHDNSSDGEGTFGIAVDVQEGLSGGFIFETNRSRQYRVTLIEGAGKYKYLTGTEKKEGWVTYKDMNKPGKSNRLGVIRQNSNLRFTINKDEVFTTPVEHGKKGQSGLFISGKMTSEVNDYTIFGPSLPETEPAPDEPVVQTDAGTNTDEVIKNDNTTPTEDLTALTNALLECRRNSQSLAGKLDNAELETRQLKSKNKELTDFIGSHLDTRLQAEVDKQKKKTEELLLENFNLLTENNQLKSFKKNIEGGKEGDLVLVLSEKLAKEQEKTAALQKEVESLKAQLKKKR
jgi:hypothetical protein